MVLTLLLDVGFSETLPPRENDVARMNVSRDDQMVGATNNMEVLLLHELLQRLCGIWRRGKERFVILILRGLEYFRRYDPPKFKGDEDSGKELTSGFKKWKRSSR